MLQPGDIVRFKNSILKRPGEMAFVDKHGILHRGKSDLVKVIKVLEMETWHRGKKQYQRAIIVSLSQYKYSIFDSKSVKFVRRPRSRVVYCSNKKNIY